MDHDGGRGLAVLLVIDNYDSFTFNLVQHLGELGEEPVVVRCDELGVDEIERMAPDRIVVSPGPCTPAEAGISVDVFRRLGSAGTPMLGVCLGHQALGEAFGGRTVLAARVMHGRTAKVGHDGRGIFQNLPSPFTTVRYHSLVTDADALPPELTPVAWSVEAEDEGEVQAMRHRTLPLWGVQFHPESLFGEHGKLLLESFVAL